MPKVSVCIPCYKQTQYLDLCLNSVFEQDYKDYEVVITDDTPDNTVADFIKEKYGNYPIRYYKNATSLGTPANWNEAITKSSGEFIKILHHDDFFTQPQSLRKFVELMEQNPNCDLAFSATEVWSVSANRKWIHKCSQKQLAHMKSDPSFLLFKNMIGAPSATIYRRNSIQFDTDLKWLVDIDFYIRVLQKNTNIVMTEEPLICTTDNTPGQVTQSVVRDKEVQLREHLRMLVKLGISDQKNFIEYFDRLFTKNKVTNLQELERVTPVPHEAAAFVKKVFSQLDQKRFLKKLADRFYGSRLNNLIFKAEQF